MEREEDEPPEESVEEADEDKTDGDKEADWTEESDDPEEDVQSRGDDLFDCVEHPRDLEKIKLVDTSSFLQAYMKLIFQWRAAVQKHTLLSLCHKDNVRKEDKEEEEVGDKKDLPGPLTKYVPQEEIVLESNLEVAAFTKLVHKKIYIISRLGVLGTSKYQNFIMGIYLSSQGDESPTCSWNDQIANCPRVGEQPRRSSDTCKPGADAWIKVFVEQSVDTCQPGKPNKYFGATFYLCHPVAEQ